MSKKGTSNQLGLQNKEILHVSKLANLTLKDSEIEIYASQLSSVLGYVDKLQKIKTENTPETSQVTGLKDVWREDKIDSSRTLTKEQALANAADEERGFFKVAAIFDEND